MTQHDRPDDEIEVTPEMVAAGLEVLRGYLWEEDWRSTDPTLVRAVVEHALVARPKPT